MLVVKKIIFVLIVVFAILNTAQAIENENLKNIAGLRVLAFVSEGLETESLSTLTIKAEVELLLKEHGLNVLSEEETKQGTVLLIEIYQNQEDAISGKLQEFFSIVKLEIKELDSLLDSAPKPRPLFIFPEDNFNNHTHSGAKFSKQKQTLWSTFKGFSGPINQFGEHTLGAVKDVTKKFINAYLKANSGQSSW